ncbi:MAG: queuosine precursor transporter [Gammaproteobacteria bacterium]|nr:queuosine precursor transporter [Gammaproteobacteria bacterium]
MFYYFPAIISLTTLLSCYVGIALCLFLAGEAGLLIYSVAALIACNLQVITAAPCWSIADTDIVVLGTTIYCSLYLSNDLIVECFGVRAARRCILLTMLGHALVTLWINLILQYPLPSQEHANYQEYITGRHALEHIFSAQFRLILAGQIAYWASHWVEVMIFSKIRKVSPNRLWIRSACSILLAMLIDTILFNALAWNILPSNPIAWEILWSDYIATNGVVQLITLIINIPVFYGILWFWRQPHLLSFFSLRSLTKISEQPGKTWAIEHPSRNCGDTELYLLCHKSGD